MLTLGPYGFLLIFLAIQLAPKSTNQILIQMDEFHQMILVKEDSGEWKRIDNEVVVPVLFRAEQTKLIAKASNGKTESIDLAEHYKITGNEKWKDLKEINPKNPDLVTAELIHEDAKLIVGIRIFGKRVESPITWVLKKEKE